MEDLTQLEIIGDCLESVLAKFGFWSPSPILHPSELPASTHVHITEPSAHTTINP